jgi:hypothetical protein
MTAASSSRRASDERGIALAMALFGLIVLGALVSGAFVVSHYNHAAATNTSYANDAEAAAETGLAEVYATWDPNVQGTLPIWDGTPATVWTDGIRSVPGSPQMTFVDSVRRLNGQLFLVQSTGRRLSAGGTVLATLAAAQVLRLVKPTIGANAAITVQEPLVFNGNAFSITGFNTLPLQWSSAECDPIDPGNTDDVVGVRSALDTGVQPQDWDNVFGFPARDAPNDPTVTSATFQSFLDYTYNTLAAQPGVKVLSASSPYTGIGPVVAGAPATCDRTAPLNFGEPLRNPPVGGAITECYDYFPVVHGTNDFTRFASDARGQGTLLVDHDLELNGNFQWVGLVIVRGRIRMSGNGNRITGAILAQGASLTSAGSISGNVDIAYSKCAIDRAVGGATMARPLGQRSWLQIY